MGSKNNNALFFTCSLIEYIGRAKKEKGRKLQIVLGSIVLREFMSMRMYSIVNPLKRWPVNL